MMTTARHSFIDADAVKNRCDLLAVIGRAVELRQRQSGDWWGCCPFHQEETPSFHVKPGDGYWKCFGCGQGGDVFDFAQRLYHTDFPGAVAILAEQAGMTAGAPLPPLPSPARPTAVSHAEEPQAWRARLAGLQPLPGSPAEAYLQRRGIGPALPAACRVKYHPAWGSRPAAVFPLYDMHGALVAAEGRYLDGKETPKVRCYGPKLAGVFVTPDAWQHDPVVIVESPINALSLAVCGVPALATCGAENMPAWLPDACRGKRVVIAFDPDPAGRDGAGKLAHRLLSAGVATYHLPLRETGRDWNDILCAYGAQVTADALQRALSPLMHTRPPRPSKKEVIARDNLTPCAPWPESDIDAIFQAIDELEKGD